jgi:peptide deformylase
MIKEIVTDLEQLKVISKQAEASNGQVIRDLLDTAMHHYDNCLGLAAVQIGYPVCIAVVRSPKSKQFAVIINPVITKRSTNKATMDEGCLSIPGTRSVTRPIQISVMYKSSLEGPYIKSKDITGVFSRVIQHEIDHMRGVLV